MQKVKQLLPVRSSTLTKLGSLVALTVAVLTSSIANADIGGYRLFKGASYQQTSNTQPAAPSGFGGDVDILFNNPTDFSTATVATPFTPTPLSPMTLSSGGPGFFIFQKGYSTLAGLDTDFPNSVLYRYTVSGGTLGSQTASLSTPSADLFASQVPFFNGTTYSQLQGMNPAAPFLFSFSGYTAPAGINAPLIFLGINRVSDGQLVYGPPSVSNTHTSIVLPASTLQGGTTYDVDLVYSCRISTPNAGFNGATSEVGFDLRTDLTFTTGSIPEPPTFALFALGSAGLITCYRSRKRKSVGQKRLRP